MNFRKEAAPGITVGDRVSRTDVNELADEGYATILDLRTRAEGAPEGVLDVYEEREVAKEAGLHYENEPVSAQGMNEAVVSKVGGRLLGLPRPILVHCASGKRAGAVTLMNLGAANGMKAEECLALAREMGFDCESEPAIKSLVVEYLEKHSPAYRDGE